MAEMLAAIGQSMLLCAEDMMGRYPVRNNHPDLAAVPPHATDMMANWLLFLPPAAVTQFKLEPNMNADTGGEKTLWVGRLCNFRKIMWLQYCKERSYSLIVSPNRLLLLSAHFEQPKRRGRGRWEWRATVARAAG